MDLRDSIEDAKSRLLSELKAATSSELVSQIRNRFLTGKESVLRGLFSLLSKVPPDRKGEEGKTLNAFKGWVEAEIERVQAALGAGTGAAEDPTLPGKIPPARPSNTGPSRYSAIWTYQAFSSARK